MNHPRHAYGAPQARTATGTTMNDLSLAHEVAQLRATVQSFHQALISLTGTRLTREQLAERLCVHYNTIPNWMKHDVLFPRPDRYGKWLLSEVIEWEQRPRRRSAAGGLQ